MIELQLNPELANPYVLPVFAAIYPYLMPLIVVSAIAMRWVRPARTILIGSATLLAVYILLCLRLYPK